MQPKGNIQLAVPGCACHLLASHFQRPSSKPSSNLQLSHLHVAVPQILTDIEHRLYACLLTTLLRK